MRWPRRSGSSSRTGCGRTRRRACAPGCRRWTTADKTGSGDYGSTNDVGVAFDPAGRRILLAMMTRSQVNDPKAPNLRLLIAELTSLVVPQLLA
jgi:beta-lactamase class A